MFGRLSFALCVPTIEYGVAVDVMVLQDQIGLAYGYPVSWYVWESLVHGIHRSIGRWHAAGIILVAFTIWS